MKNIKQGFMIDITKMEHDSISVSNFWLLPLICGLNISYQWPGKSGLGSLPMNSIFISQCAIEHNKLFCFLHKAALEGHIYVCYKDEKWFDDQCSHAFGLKQEAHLQWTNDHSQVKGEVSQLTF